jgi:hypothetical protein
MGGRGDLVSMSRKMDEGISRERAHHPCLCVCALASVQIPRDLFKADGYAHKEALFGIPVYGGFIAEKLYYIKSSKLCTAPTAEEVSLLKDTDYVLGNLSIVTGSGPGLAPI